MKQLIVFDLDGTLADSKSSLESAMSGLVHDLLGFVKVAVISGGNWPQFEEQVLAGLPQDERLANLSLLPTCGTKFFQRDGVTWSEIYSEDLSPAEKSKIIGSLQRSFDSGGLTVWGEVIEDRGSQVTFSALGQQAPLDAKDAWDPDFAQRGSNLSRRPHRGEDHVAVDDDRARSTVHPSPREGWDSFDIRAWIAGPGPVSDRNAGGGRLTR